MRLLFILFFAIYTSLATSLVQAQTVGDTQVGVASFYSDEFDGDRTAYGEVYRKGELVAAHSLYPHNSVVRVVNNANGKSTSVRIIDQGPWIEGRIIEVSRRAAEILGFVNEGTTRVTLTLVSTPGQPAVARSTPREEDTPRTRARDEAPRVPAPSTYNTPQAPRREDNRTAEESAQENEVESNIAPPPADRATQKPAVVRENATETEKKATTFVPAQDNHPFATSGTFADGVYKVEIREPGTGEYGVQVAALGDLNSAMQYIATLQSKWFTNILIRKTGELHKVILGPFATQQEASVYAKDLKRKYKMNGFTVSLK